MKGNQNYKKIYPKLFKEIMRTSGTEVIKPIVRR